MRSITGLWIEYELAKRAVRKGAEGAREDEAPEPWGEESGLTSLVRAVGLLAVMALCYCWAEGLL
jgi:hypothetical protein